MPTINRILCPVDFSDTAAAGAREAAALARAAHAELVLVHVLSEPWLRSQERGYSAPIVQQYEIITRQKLEALAEPLSRVVPVRSVMLYGAVDEAIAENASRLSADLIVMGTRPHKGIARLLRDSTTEKLMRRVRIPVVRVSQQAARPSHLGMTAGHGTA